jgi:hypothetical protein
MKKCTRRVSSVADNPWTPPCPGGHPGQTPPDNPSLSGWTTPPDQRPDTPVQMGRVWTGSDNCGHPWTGQEERWV